MIYEVFVREPNPITMRIRASSVADAVIRAHHRLSRTRRPFALPEASTITVRGQDGAAMTFSAEYVWPEPGGPDPLGCGPYWEDHDWTHYSSGGENLCRCRRCCAVVSLRVNEPRKVVVYDFWGAE